MTRCRQQVSNVHGLVDIFRVNCIKVFLPGHKCCHVSLKDTESLSIHFSKILQEQNVIKHVGARCCSGGHLFFFSISHTMACLSDTMTVPVFSLR